VRKDATNYTPSYFTQYRKASLFKAYDHSTAVIRMNKTGQQCTNNSHKLSVRSSLFWDCTQRRLLISYRRFGLSYRSHLQRSSSLRRISYSPWTASALKMGPIGCSETSVNNYQSTLCNIPEERRSNLRRGGIVTSRIHSHSHQVPFRG
jgi:hypothetical protein